MSFADEARPFRALTRGGEGFDRRAFTVDDIFKMIRAGIIDEDENFELFDGEIVPMSPESTRHWLMKSVLSRYLVEALPRSFVVATDSTLRMSGATFIEPDAFVISRDHVEADPIAPHVLLVVEIAVSTLERDLTRKALLCARHAIEEYWVIDADSRTTHVHTKPAFEGYGSIEVRKADDIICPERLSPIAFRYNAVFDA